MNRAVQQRAHIPARRGVTLAYIAVGAVAFIGICSLAADYGRVQLAKTELRQGADAAARAGVLQLPNVQAVQDEAASIAAANQAAGAPIAFVKNDDVAFLTWNQTTGTCVVRTGADRARANAIRVTTRLISSRGNAVNLYLGRGAGMPTCDVQASATTMINRNTAPGEFGFVGLDNIDVVGNIVVDSFNSASGAPGGANRRHRGSIGSNGDISITGSSTVYGDARAGVGQDLTLDPDSYVTGSTMNISEELEYETPNPGLATLVNSNATIPGSFLKNSGRDLEVGNNQTLTLTAGVYYVRNLQLSGGGTITTHGPVTVYAYGTVDLAGNTSASANRAANFKIRVTGSGQVQLAGTSEMTADILAPLSHILLNGTPDYRGRIIGRTLRINGNPRLHFDETLATLTDFLIPTQPTVHLVD